MPLPVPVPVPVPVPLLVCNLVAWLLSDGLLLYLFRVLFCYGEIMTVVVCLDRTSAYSPTQYSQSYVQHENAATCKISTVILCDIQSLHKIIEWFFFLFFRFFVVVVCCCSLLLLPLLLLLLMLLLFCQYIQWTIPAAVPFRWAKSAMHTLHTKPFRMADEVLKREFAEKSQSKMRFQFS